MKRAWILVAAGGCSFSAPSAGVGGGSDAAGGSDALHADALHLIDAGVHHDARPIDAHVCPADFAPITGGPAQSVYLIHPYSASNDPSTTFAIAQGGCVAAGGYLAIPNSQAELTALDDAIAQNPMASATGEGFWVGLTDAATEGTWLTVRGTPAPFLGWASGQPNGGMQANCAAGFVDALYDVACTEFLPYACECED